MNIVRVTPMFIAPIVPVSARKWDKNVCHLGSKPLPGGRTYVTRCYGNRVLQATACEVNDGVLQARREVMRKLRHDLKIQYDSPREMDWTIYDGRITFDDPMTKLSGKLQYKVRKETTSICYYSFLTHMFRE